MTLADVYKVDVHFTLQRNPNVYCFAYLTTATSEPGTLDIQELAAGFSPKVTDAIKVWSDDSVVFNCYVVSLLKRGQPGDESIPLKVVTTLMDTFGDRTLLDALPGQCSAVVQTLPSEDSTAARRRGRDFITGLTEVDQTDGKWLQATANLVLNQYIANILTDVVGAGTGVYNYGNWSPTQHAENIDPQFVSNGGAVPDPPTFGNNPFNEVTEVRMVETVRTQRQRQPEDVCAILLEDAT